MGPGAGWVPGEPRRPREREAEEDIGWECSTWSGEEGRREGGGRTWGRELGARVRLVCSEQGGLPRAVHVAGLEMRGLCLGNKALGVLGALLCSCCWVHGAETSFRGDWCLGDARRMVPWTVVDLGSGRPRTCLGPHGWGGAGGCPWTRESVFSWLNGSLFPGWS